MYYACGLFSESSHYGIIKSMLSDLTPQEKEFYERFRTAHEAYEKCAWDYEYITADIKRKKAAGQPVGDLEIQRDAASSLLSAELEKIKALGKEAGNAFSAAKMFGKEVVERDGLLNTIQRQIERAVFEGSEAAYPNILKTALLNAFLKREQETRSSIYKKRFRGGFRDSAETLIAQERQKNETWREELLAKNASRLLPQDIDLLRLVFRLRMARHGMEEEVFKGGDKS